MARDALGIAVDDPRPLTVTGGLAYHGGPGNNYCTHAIAETATRIRDDRPVQGIVIGRLQDGRRFVANTPDDPALLTAMTDEEFLRREGRVQPRGRHNLFLPAL
jgi:hypothetical protein